MKVAHILRRFDKKDWGGIESVCLNLCAELQHSNVNVEILATNAMSETYEEKYHTVQIKRFPYFYPYLYFSKNKRDQFDRKGGNPISPKLISYLDRSKPNLIHLHTMGFLGASVIKWARENKVPVALSLHGGYFDVTQGEKKDFQDIYKGTIGLSRFIKILYPSEDLLRHADGIICVGKNEQIKGKEKHPNKKIKYIPNGVNADIFEVERQHNFFNDYLNISSNKKVLLYQSRIDQQKNQKQIIQIAQALKDMNALDSYHFLIQGPVMNEQYFEQMIQEVKDLELVSSFTFKRGVKPESIEHIQSFLNAEAFLFPTLHEPFGIVALEAWAAKIPVICSGSGGLAHFVKDEENGFIIDPSNSVEWAKKIMELPKVRKFIVTKANQDVINDFSWKNCAHSTIEFYEQLLCT